MDPSTPIEAQWHGAYTTLLTMVFSPLQGFLVTPQYYALKNTGAIIYIDYTIENMIFSMTVEQGSHPVFFLELRPRTHILEVSDRAAADFQMREHFKAFASRSVVGKLYGLSVMGTLFAIYTYERETKRVTPKAILPDPEYVTNTAPMSRWEYDLLEETGARKFMEIVDAVKSQTAAVDVSTLRRHKEECDAALKHILGGSNVQH